MELLKQIEYEKLLILGNTEYLYYYNHFYKNVRDSIIAASQLLIK